MNRIVVTKYNNHYLIIFIKDDIAVKIRAIENLDLFPDAIYLGRVKTVKNNISASFVSYGNGNTGFINNDSRKPETVFPVMVKKKSSGNKEDVLTDSITLSGIYCVVGNSIHGIKKSKRLDKLLVDNSEYENVIFRINSANAHSSDIYNEYCYLKERLNSINKYANMRTEKSILYNGMSALMKALVSEDLSEYEEVLTDSQEVIDNFISLENEYKINSISLPVKIRKYEDNLISLAAFISLSSKLDDALLRKVYLKSDAYIVIDHTEAMTVIDVNSGTTRNKGTKDEVLHKVNLEAAKEIVRQLKLRNISGIIIIDFINVKDKAYNDELVSYIRTLLKEDDCNAVCHGITNLSLIEITRDRRDLSLREQLKNGNSTDK